MKMYKNAIVILGGCQYFITARSDDRNEDEFIQDSRNGLKYGSTNKELDRIIGNDVTVKIITLPGEYTKEEAIARKKALIETLRNLGHMVINGRYFSAYKTLSQLEHQGYGIKAGE